MNFLDDVVQGMINTLPEKWRPYVMLVFIFLYVATKVRAYFKAQAETKLANDLGVKAYPHKRNAFQVAVDFVL